MTVALRVVDYVTARAGIGRECRVVAARSRSYYRKRSLRGRPVDRLGGAFCAKKGVRVPDAYPQMHTTHGAQWGGVRREDDYQAVQQSAAQPLMCIN